MMRRIFQILPSRVPAEQLVPLGHLEDAADGSLTLHLDAFPIASTDGRARLYVPPPGAQVPAMPMFAPPPPQGSPMPYGAGTPVGSHAPQGQPQLQPTQPTQSGGPLAGTGRPQS